jgi:hypothetical protein
MIVIILLIVHVNIIIRWKDITMLGIMKELKELHDVLKYGLSGVYLEE